MLDLLVIGGGYWGVAIALKARERGWEATVIDNQDKFAGSRNASAICDPSSYRSKIFAPYLPSGWSQSDLRESFDWLMKHGGKMTGEWFWNTFQGTEPRKRNEAIYLESNEDFTNLFPTTKDEATGLERRGKVWEVTTEKGETILARRVAIAAGYRTDSLLERLRMPTIGVGRLFGRGLVAAGKPSAPIPVSVMTRPYTKHTIRTWGKGLYRVGDTAEGTEPNPKRADDLREVAEATLEGFREVSWPMGFRPTLPQYLVDKLAPGLVVATGGHRLGLGLAGLVGSKAMDCFA